MTLQTLNNIRELAQQLRVGSVRRRRCPGRPVSGRAAITSRRPATRRGPNDYAGGRRNSVASTGLGRPVPRAGGSPANFGRPE